MPLTVPITTWETSQGGHIRGNGPDNEKGEDYLRGGPIQMSVGRSGGLMVFQNAGCWELQQMHVSSDEATSADL
jgi:hypothetical protein